MSNYENKIRIEDSSVHDWYRFVLSFPPHLVQHYLDEFGANENTLVLDPFCGTGTTNVECKKRGIPSWGIEASPITHFASKTKCTWLTDLSGFLIEAERIAQRAKKRISTSSQLKKLTDEQEVIILKNSISEQPLSDALFLREEIEKANSKYVDYFLLALAKHIVYSYSNLKFGPEVGISRKKKDSVDVVGIWQEEIMRMYKDLLDNMQNAMVSAEICHGDARDIVSHKYLKQVDFVITSPPYPNEKDYSRTTRLESVILGYIKDKKDLRQVKQKFIRSNTKNVYCNDDDSSYVEGIETINTLSKVIEDRRIELGKTSGFERLYSSVVKHYFGGMAKHLLSLKPYLRDGAILAYVVGDQASYFQIPIRTASILGEVAESLGCYRVERIDTFRKRFATATESWLNEDVLILRYKEN